MNGAGAGVLPVDVWLAIATILLCVALSAFFSASETALTAASRARMHALEKNGDRRAALVNRLLASRARLIGTTLLGNTLVTTGASAFATSILVALTGERGALYATGLMTVLLLVFAEVMPKTVAINYPDRTSLLVARAISIFVAVFGPVLIGVEVLVRGFLKVAGVDTSRRQSILSGHRRTEKRGGSSAPGGRRRDVPTATCSAACSIFAISKCRTLWFIAPKCSPSTPICRRKI